MPVADAHKTAAEASLQGRALHFKQHLCVTDKHKQHDSLQRSQQSGAFAYHVNITDLDWDNTIMCADRLALLAKHKPCSFQRKIVFQSAHAPQTV